MPVVAPLAIPAFLWAAGSMGGAEFFFNVIVYGSLLLFQPEKSKGRKADRGRLVNVRDPEESLPLVYGTCRVGVNTVYPNTSGSENKYLHLICALAEGECNGIHKVWDSDNSQMEYGIYFDDELYTKFGSWAYNIYPLTPGASPTAAGSDNYWEFHSGTPNQDYSSVLYNKFSTFTDPMRNTCYLYIRLLFDPDIFNGVPNITVALEGKKVFDPRDSAWKFSTNPVLCLRDFMINKRYGKGESIDCINIDSDESFMSVCNEIDGSTALSGQVTFTEGSTTVTSSAGGFNTDLSAGDWIKNDTDDFWVQVKSVDDDFTCTLVKRYQKTGGADTASLRDHPWQINAAFMGDMPCHDIVQEILKTYRGGMIYSPNGEYKLSYMDLVNYESSVMDIEESDIIDGSLKIETGSCFDRPNRYKIQFYDYENNWKLNEFYVDSASYDSLTQEENLETIMLEGITDYRTAMAMAAYIIDRGQYDKRISFRMIEKGLELDALDPITLTHSMPGWSQKALRVLKTSYADHIVDVICLEDTTALYDDTVNVNTHEIYDTTFPDPKEVLGDVQNVSASESTYTERGRTLSRIGVSFDPPIDDGSNTNIWWEKTHVFIAIMDTPAGGGSAPSSSDYRYFGTFDNNDTRQFYIQAIQEDKRYYIKFQNETYAGTKQTFSSAYSTYVDTIGALNVTPSNPTNFYAVSSNDAVTLIAEVGTSIGTDLEGYEFRWSCQDNSNYLAAVTLGFNKKPVYSIAGMRPGSHRFWVAAKHYNGRYSTGTYYDVTVPTPSGYTLETPKTIDQGSGSHNGTEFEDKGGGDYVLKVDHTGSNLDGTFTSAEIDLGSSGNWRLWGDFITSLVSSSIWTTIWPEGEAWNYPAADPDNFTETWAALAGTGTSATIEATLYWDTSSHAAGGVGDYANSAKFFEILGMSITAQYIRITITITDPDSSSYLYLDGGSGNTVLTINYAADHA